MYHLFKLAPEGVVLPMDHGRDLLVALSKPFPFLHGRHDVQIAPVRGARSKYYPRMVLLDCNSFLQIRGLTDEEARLVASGGTIFVGRERIQMPTQYRKVGYTPSERLVSRLVLLRDCKDRESFIAELMRRLPRRDGIEIRLGGTSSCARIKPGIAWRGWKVELKGLTPEESLAIQRTGIGHARSLGCGVFYPGTCQS